MTDGIIQKVFKKHWHILHAECFPTSYMSKIEQELIEEIKRTYLGWSSRQNKIELIGDNE